MTEGLQKADKTLGFYKSGKEVLRSTEMWLWWRAAQSHGSPSTGEGGPLLQSAWPAVATQQNRQNENQYEPLVTRF